MGDRKLLDARQIAEVLPSRPVVSTGYERQRDLIVEHYRHPPSIIDVPGIENNLIVVHLNGPLVVEERQENGVWARKWADERHVTLTPAGAPVARRFQSRPEVLLVQLTPRLIGEVVEDAFDRDPRHVSIVPCFVQLDAMLSHYAELLMSEVQSSTMPGYALMLDLFGRAIAINLLRHHSTLQRTRAEAPVQMSPVRMRRVIDYMREEMAHNPGLTELAAVCGLSPTHFARMFRATTGVSPHRYLLSLRMEQARNLLETTTLPIAQVALACGFEQPSSFATAFRQIVGMSPRTWRTERRHE